MTDVTREDLVNQVIEAASVVVWEYEVFEHDIESHMIKLRKALAKLNLFDELLVDQKHELAEHT